MLLSALQQPLFCLHDIATSPLRVHAEIYENNQHIGHCGSLFTYICCDSLLEFNDVI